VVSSIEGEGEGAVLSQAAAGARKRAAVETYARHEDALRRTARRYSLCLDDADDALQRALEILLLKAPTEDPRELIRWTQTVVKHEALAVRRDRERILSGPAAAAPEPGREDWVAMIATDADGPPERAERHEAIVRSREALQSLKPQELRALSLLAEGYSYREIGEITGFSQTKINRCLAEGRERFRSLLARSEDGSRCKEMGPLLSAFCDGEAASEDVTALREHLRACAGCRATLRAYRAAPRAAAALAPALAVDRTLLERAHDAFSFIAGRFGGGGATADTALSQVAAGGGTGGAGMAALAKAVALCVGSAGGAAACVATGVVPAPLELGAREAKAPALERTIDPVNAPWTGGSGVDYAPTPIPSQPEPEPEPEAPIADADPAPVVEPAPEPEPAAASGAVEYAPEPEPAPVVAPSASPAVGSPAGEFGP
jgi:RNA polymerase sigma factor (sigma-70 family)